MTHPAMPNGNAFEGPLESGTFPDRLRAHAVTPGPHPRLWGYDVTSDLSANYSFSDLVFLSLKGELPTIPVSRAFARVLMLLAPVTVAEAPSHAAVLARLSGADTGSTLGVATIGLAEQAKEQIRSLMPLLSWLDDPSTEFPSSFLDSEPTNREAATSLAALMQQLGLLVRGLEYNPGYRASLICVLHACGLRTAEHLESVWVLCRLPCVLAEAFAVKPTAFRDYPSNLPTFCYSEGAQ